MRNLVALARRATQLRRQEAVEAATTARTAVSVDCGGERAFFLRSDGRVAALDLSEASTTADELVDLYSALEDAEPADSDAQWRWVQYVAELDALVCARSDGVLAVVNVETCEAEEVGALAGGIRALSWSDGQEKLAVATGGGSLLVMSQQWDVLYEAQWASLLPPGSLGSLESEETQGVELCWRDDGRFLAMNAPVTANTEAGEGVAQRKVLVFTHELELHAVGRLEDGRPLPNLGKSLHWSAAKALIASSETRGDRLWVVYFERNGLRHGEFELPGEFSPAQAWDVERVRWSVDGEVLAVHLKKEKTEDQAAQSVVQMWARGNYHWYLKQEQRWTRSDLVAFDWDDEAPSKLYFLVLQASKDGQLSSLSLIEEEFTSSITSVEAQTPLLQSIGASIAFIASTGAPSTRSVAVTAVIDGCKLLLTPLHQAVVPPPFALRTVELPAAVNSVAFDSQTETLLALVSTGELFLVRNYLSVKPVVAKLTISSGDKPELSSLLRISYDPRTSRLVLAAKAGWSDVLVAGFCILGDENEGVKVSVAPVKGVDGPRVACDVAVASTTDQEVDEKDSQLLPRVMALQCHNGDVYALHVDHNNPESTFTAPQLIAQRVPAFSAMAVAQSSDAMTVIGLQERTSRLFVGSQAIVSGCSSFRLCPVSSSLLCTTVGSDTELRILPLSSVISQSLDSILGSSLAQQTPWEARKIEQGAQLVGVIGDRAVVVLQLPRGNLESVSPRLLVLALVIALLRRQALAAALELCRTHRLDMNVLVDYDREGFMTSFSARLLRELVDFRPVRVVSDRLSLFVTNLHPVDVWRDKYEPQYRAFGPPRLSTGLETDSDASEKVNTVCRALMDAIRDHLRRGEDGDLDALLLPYLTCAVKQTPPQLVEALGKIQELASGSSSPKTQQLQRSALKHLVMLTDADTLFNEALGMYDLALVRQVAAFSDRDPREYAPLLDELAATYDLNERKLRIDMHLERFDRALGHLNALVRAAIASGSSNDGLKALEERVESLVARGALHTQGLSLFRDLPALRKRLTLLHGQHLEAEKRFTDAAFVYLSVSAVFDAQRAFTLARHWRMALSLSIRARQTRDQVRQLAYQLAEEMLNHQSGLEDVVEVAQVYAEYCGDLDEAVALLVTHKQWMEAMRLALLHNRGDLVETDVEPGALQSHEELVQDLKQQEAAYVKNWRRLDAVQTQKRLFRVHGIDGKRWGHEQDDDAESDARSLASSAASSALSSASMSSVGSHNSARSIGNFSMQSLSHATSSHFYATQALHGAAASTGKGKSKSKGGTPSRRERRNRMKEGSAQEEAYVTQQLMELKPSDALRREAKQLLEMLVLFGHTERATELQAQLAAFERRVDGENPPPGASEATGDGAVAHREKWRLEALSSLE